MSDEFDLYQLLAAPIKAANDAQAEVAARFVDHLEMLAFEPLTSDEQKLRHPPVRRLRELTFTARSGRVDEAGNELVQHISVPILQLVALSGLHIETAKLEFSCELASTASPPQQKNMAAAPSVPELPRQLGLRGRIAHTGGVTPGAKPGNFHVELQLNRTDLPAGFLDMIAATHSTARMSPKPRTELAPSSSAVIVSEKLVTAIIEGVDPAQFTSGNEVSGIIQLNFLEQTGKGRFDIRLSAAPDDLVTLIRPSSTSISAFGKKRLPFTVYLPVSRQKVTKARPVSLTLTCDFFATEGEHFRQELTLPIKQRQ